MKVMAHWNVDRGEARDLIDRTFLGRQVLISECLDDLGRAIAGAARADAAALLRLGRRLSGRP